MPDAGIPLSEIPFCIEMALFLFVGLPHRLAAVRNDTFICGIATLPCGGSQ